MAGNTSQRTGTPKVWFIEERLNFCKCCFAVYAVRINKLEGFTFRGVSRTLATVDVPGGWIEVALIPTTLAKTTLQSLAEGDGVNIEADAMAKTIVHWLKNFAQSARPDTGPR